MCACSAAPGAVGALRRQTVASNVSLVHGRCLSVSHFLDSEHLRVLIANQRPERLDRVTTIVVGLGHEVIARSIEVEDVAAMTARERPDVALVGLGESSAHALDLIDQIVRAAA